jgi:hypothetical protein
MRFYNLLLTTIFSIMYGMTLASIDIFGIQPRDYFIVSLEIFAISGGIIYEIRFMRGRR